MNSHPWKEINYSLRNYNSIFLENIENNFLDKFWQGRPDLHLNIKHLFSIIPVFCSRWFENKYYWTETSAVVAGWSKSPCFKFKQRQKLRSQVWIPLGTTISTEQSFKFKWFIQSSHVYIMQISIRVRHIFATCNKAKVGMC